MIIHENSAKFILKIKEKLPVNNKNNKINKEPKNILPKATVLELNSFKARFEIIVSIAQNKVAININKSPKPRLNEFIFNNNKLPISNRIAPIRKPLLSFSFKKINAKTET